MYKPPFHYSSTCLHDPGLPVARSNRTKEEISMFESDMRQGWQVSLPDLASELTADSHHVTLWPLHYISCWARQFMINQLIALADSTAEVLSVWASSQQQVTRPCLLICINFLSLIWLTLLSLNLMPNTVICLGNRKIDFSYHCSIQLRTTLGIAIFVNVNSYSIQS